MPNIPNYPPQGIQAQLDLLYLYNPDVANALTAKLDAGLIQLEELQQQVDAALKDLQGVLRYKGSVATKADLPTEGNTIGDVWNVLDTDKNYAWDGTQWDEFGAGIDTSVFLTQTEADQEYVSMNQIQTTTGAPATKNSKIPNVPYLNTLIYTPTYTSQMFYLTSPTTQKGMYFYDVLGRSSFVPGAAGTRVAYISVSGGSSLYDTANALCIKLVSTSYSTTNKITYTAEVVYDNLGEEWDLYYGPGFDVCILPRAGQWTAKEYLLGALRFSNKQDSASGQSFGVYLGLSPAWSPFIKMKITKPLPSQTDNAGKFLTTDGTNASWATVQQASGGGIVWDKEFTASKAQINGDNDNQYCGLSFKLPAGLPDGEYEFTYGATGLPEVTNGTTEFWTMKLFLTRIKVESGVATYGTAWHVFSPEYGASISGNLGASDSTELFITDGSEFRTVFSGLGVISEIGSYSQNIDTIYDTLKITKLKNTTTGELYEFQNVQQTFEYNGSFEFGFFTIVAMNFLSFPVSDYQTQTYMSDLTNTDSNSFVITGVPNPFFIPKNDKYWGGWAPAKKIRLTAWGTNIKNVLIMDIEISPQKITATLVQATGGLNLSYSVYIPNDSTQSNVPLYVYVHDKKLPNNTVCVLTWVGNQGGQNLYIYGGQFVPDEYYSEVDVVPASTSATEAWAQNTFINADASMYTLATLQDAFNYSNARLYKIFNEAKMPTTDTYTLFSLGWTYTDSENIPTLIASNAANGKLYYYHGTYDNCEPATWQEFNFGEGGGDYLPLSGGTLTGTLGVSTINNGTDLTVPTTGTALATIEDVMEHSELPSQEGNAGKVLTTDGETVTWSEPGIPMPALPDDEGTYVLKCVVSNGAKTLQWVVE